MRRTPQFFHDRKHKILLVSGLLLATGTLFPQRSHAAEHIVLKNGFDLVCDHQQAEGDRVRLYMDAGASNFMDVNPSDIATVEHVDLPRPSVADATSKQSAVTQPAARLTPDEMRQLLTQAGSKHDLDVDLLASVVRAESGGNPRAVSRTGAQGLMQLMPKTAATLGVSNSFAADENINGGTAYLDALLKKYHDNLALALAAYNAGPEAVARWHGIPPYRETRAYVARVIHEFNRRYAARLAAARQAATTQIASSQSVVTSTQSAR
jgi:soluble lytic murein transglycosylase-like protein